MRESPILKLSAVYLAVILLDRLLPLPFGWLIIIKDVVGVSFLTQAAELVVDKV